MRRILVALIAAAVLLLPSSAHAVKDRTPPCRSEDGPGRCVWDARHMGNGHGKSYVIRKDGSVNYVKHRRAHRLWATSA